jgi:hypothetical protein
LGQYLFKYGYFLVQEGGTTVAFYAALPFALRKVAAESAVYYVV